VHPKSDSKSDILVMKFCWIFERLLNYEHCCIFTAPEDLLVVLTNGFGILEVLKSFVIFLI